MLTVLYVATQCKCIYDVKIKASKTNTKILKNNLLPFSIDIRHRN